GGSTADRGFSAAVSAASALHIGANEVCRSFAAAGERLHGLFVQKIERLLLDLVRTLVDQYVLSFARSRDIDLNQLTNSRRYACHDQEPIGKEYCFIDVGRDEKRSTGMLLQ